MDDYEIKEIPSDQEILQAWFSYQKAKRQEERRENTRLRIAVFRKYGRKCLMCGSSKKVQVDHIKPVSRFPELAKCMDNLQPLCARCNNWKSDKFLIDCRPGADRKVRKI